MNYTEVIRNYCKEHLGQFFDGAVMYDGQFSFVEKESYHKILQRLVKEGLLSEYDKGTYIIAGGYQAPRDLILDFYTGYDSGMLVGPAIYYEEHISTVQPKPIEIYTSKIPSGKHKTVKEFSLTGVDLTFDRATKSIICTLELIRIGKKIAGIDFVRYQEVRERGVYNYSDAKFVRILKALKFSYSTIVFYADSLSKADIDNHALEIYEKIAKGRSIEPEDYTTRPERIISEVEFD